eukprot:1433048-Pyramimonas_sp.AAC.1
MSGMATVAQHLTPQCWQMASPAAPCYGSEQGGGEEARLRVYQHLEDSEGPNPQSLQSLKFTSSQICSCRAPYLPTLLALLLLLPSPPQCTLLKCDLSSESRLLRSWETDFGVLAPTSDRAVATRAAVVTSCAI